MKIIYDFCDGTIQEIEVSDELFAVYKKLLQKEKQNHWTETRRHISLDNLKEQSDKIDIVDTRIDLLAKVIDDESEAEIHKLLSSILSPKQKDLFAQSVFEGKTLTEIAANEGVSISAVCQRLKTIYKKIKIFFEKP